MYQLGKLALWKNSKIRCNVKGKPDPEICSSVLTYKLAGKRKRSRPKLDLGCLKKKGKFPN